MQLLRNDSDSGSVTVCREKQNWHECLMCPNWLLARTSNHLPLPVNPYKNSNLLNASTNSFIPCSSKFTWTRAWSPWP